MSKLEELYTTRDKAHAAWGQAIANRDQAIANRGRDSADLDRANDHLASAIIDWHKACAAIAAAEGEK